MKRRRLAGSASFGFLSVGKFLAAAPIIVALVPLAASPAYSLKDDVGMYGSIDVAKAAKIGVQAMRNGRWKDAQSEFRKAIGFDGSHEELYFGLYDASCKANEWGQATLALEQLFDKSPRYKNELCLEYGQCLYNLNRYSEAEPLLKQALSSVAQPSIVEKKVALLKEKADPAEGPPLPGPIVAWTPPKPIVRPPRDGELSSEKVDNESKKSLSFLNAYMKSESVVIAEYVGYDADQKVSFFDPPVVNFKIVEFLKGSKLNKSLPIKFDFHSKTRDEAKPVGWKWSQDLLPQAGSKWILFIENGVPTDGAFETFKGQYGRQPLNDNTLDEIKRIVEEHQGQSKQ